MTKPRCLGICLFYNDDDIVDDAITHLLENNHDVIVWDHGSTDGTSTAIDRYAGQIKERHFLPRSFDFYKLFEHVSRYVIDNLAGQYDWISFPESDEILEGPDRTKSYFDHVCDVVESPYDFLRFHNVVFWWTSKDDASILSPRQRMRHYSVWHDCPPRIYAWRARCSNVRLFNHNDALGIPNPRIFKTCHYQWRSDAQAIKRIEGRAGLRRGAMNVHFDNMSEVNRLRLSASQLNFDDGGELSMSQTVDFRKIYGT